MRICLAVTNDLSYDQRMHRICATLVDAGYQVTLIGRRLPESKPLRNWRFRCVRLRCLSRRGPAFYAEYNLRLFLWLLFARYAIAVACDLDTALAIALSGKLRGRICVHDAHEMFSEVPELSGRAFVKRFWQWVGRLTVPRFAARYTVGPAIASALGERYGAPFTVVRNVPEKGSAPVVPIEERRKVILYQGALNAGRGLECAIDAMAYLEGYTLQIIGEGDLSQVLRQRVQDAGLEDKVEFTGRVSPAELPAYTSRAMVGLNLLENTSLSYYYSLANKFFDYMHAGTPSINMRFPEYESIIAQHAVGICIDVLDVEAYVAQLSALLRDRDALRAMHDAAIRAREVFCWEEEQGKLLEIYAGVLK